MFNDLPIYILIIFQQGVRKFPTGDRCRLLVSDGIHKSAFAILASQLNGVTNTENMENAVVNINRYYCNETTEANGDKPFKKVWVNYSKLLFMF